MKYDLFYIDDYDEVKLSVIPPKNVKLASVYKNNRHQHNSSTEIEQSVSHGLTYAKIK